MLMILPDELLLSIVEHFDCIPTKPTLYFQFYLASPDIISLSIVSWRWRRICLPFLLANVKFTAQQVVKFREFCLNNPSLSRLIKSIYPQAFSSIRQEQQHVVLCRTLPILDRLCCVDLTDMDPTLDVLRLMLQHPTVTVLRLRSSGSLPVGSLQLDLSKVVVDRVVFSQRNPAHTLDPFLRRGLKVASATLYRFDLLGAFNRLSDFSGLEEVELISVTSYEGILNWATNHPRLRTLRFTNDDPHTDLAWSLTNSFRDNLHEQNLGRHFRVTYVKFSRDDNDQAWWIESMRIVATFNNHSLIEILSVLASHFPRLQALYLDLSSHRATYLADNFAAALGYFPCLRNLHLIHVFHRLELEQGQPLLPLRPLTGNSSVERDAVHTEAGVVWLASHLAKKLRPLEAIHIEEANWGHLHSIGIYGRHVKWNLKGWILVDDGREIDSRLILELPEEVEGYDETELTLL
ncbi:hypothetical protein D9757_003327 [Collybiopsis confluens]|uniref:F-box domain-containing protein n=1 Tax=Collybiopsis confluens TaxID=2823264 RepID=A0A8H5HYP2_9AGAR|nr:hypothetical protein D9757_003327 [Collybiopsis confluens]